LPSDLAVARGVALVHVTYCTIQIKRDSFQKKCCW